ncbi:hypothetical protein SNEBB_008462 [Seison nebaliae]|nr:hypothetical protein SNEBB_008462 [Seison nebaliae]
MNHCIGCGKEFTIFNREKSCALCKQVLCKSCLKYTDQLTKKAICRKCKEGDMKKDKIEMEIPEQLKKLQEAHSENHPVSSNSQMIKNLEERLMNLKGKKKTNISTIEQLQLRLNLLKEKKAFEENEAAIKVFQSEEQTADELLKNMKDKLKLEDQKEKPKQSDDYLSEDKIIEKLIDENRINELIRNDTIDEDVQPLPIILSRILIWIGMISLKAFINKWSPYYARRYYNIRSVIEGNPKETTIFNQKDLLKKENNLIDEMKMKTNSKDLVHLLSGKRDHFSMVSSKVSSINLAVSVFNNFLRVYENDNLMTLEDFHSDPMFETLKNCDKIIRKDYGSLNHFELITYFQTLIKLNVNFGMKSKEIDRLLLFISRNVPSFTIDETIILFRFIQLRTFNNSINLQMEKNEQIPLQKKISSLRRSFIDNFLKKIDQIENFDQIIQIQMFAPNVNILYEKLDEKLMGIIQEGNLKTENYLVLLTMKSFLRKRNIHLLRSIINRLNGLIEREHLTLYENALLVNSLSSLHLNEAMELLKYVPSTISLNKIEINEHFTITLQNERDNSIKNRLEEMGINNNPNIFSIIKSFGYLRFTSTILLRKYLKFLNKTLKNVKVEEKKYLDWYRTITLTMTKFSLKSFDENIWENFGNFQKKILDRCLKIDMDEVEELGDLLQLIDICWAMNVLSYTSKNKKIDSIVKQITEENVLSQLATKLTEDYHSHLPHFIKLLQMISLRSNSQEEDSLFAKRFSEMLIESPTLKNAIVQLFTGHETGKYQNPSKFTKEHMGDISQKLATGRRLGQMALKNGIESSKLLENNANIQYDQLYSNGTFADAQIDYLNEKTLVIFRQYRDAPINNTTEDSIAFEFEKKLLKDISNELLIINLDDVLQCQLWSQKVKKIRMSERKENYDVKTMDDKIKNDK